MTLSEQQLLNAIEWITSETGYPPDADELAAVYGVTTQQVQSTLAPAKRRGAVRYDDEARLIVEAP